MIDLSTSVSTVENVENRILCPSSRVHTTLLTTAGSPLLGLYLKLKPTLLSLATNMYLAALKRDDSDDKVPLGRILSVI